MALVPINLGVPTGTVMWFAGQEVPFGWLLCDGGSFSSMQYPVLAEYVGEIYGPRVGDNYTLPNLIGGFIRGIGETGRAFGSTQPDMFTEHLHGMFPNKTHTHTITDPTHIHIVNDPGHNHTTSGTHNHATTEGGHRHLMKNPATGYSILAIDANTNEYLYVGYRYCADTHVSSFFCPLFVDTLNFTWNVATTNISVNTGPTNIVSPSHIALTNVTFLTTITNIHFTDQAQTDISIDDFGVPNTRPENLALLPIIRT